MRLKLEIIPHGQRLTVMTNRFKDLVAFDVRLADSMLSIANKMITASTKLIELHKKKQGILARWFGKSK